MALVFTVYGVAQPKGSARAFVPKGWKRPIVTSANPKNKGWQQLIAEAAHSAIAADAAFKPLDSAACLRVAFLLPRPKAIRNRFVMHTKKPDLDKLVRSVKDALTKVAWLDDALVVKIVATKGYAPPGEAPRAEISVGPV